MDTCAMNEQLSLDHLSDLDRTPRPPLRPGSWEAYDLRLDPTVDWEWVHLTGDYL